MCLLDRKKSYDENNRSDWGSEPPGVATPSLYRMVQMDANLVILSATIGCVEGRLLGKLLMSMRSAFIRVLGFALLWVMYFWVSLPKLGEFRFEGESGRESRYEVTAKLILFYLIGFAMACLFTKILQDCVRMDGRRALASTILFAMVWLLTIILHYCVVRMDRNYILGFAIGYVLEEVILQSLWNRLYHEYKKCQPIQAPVQESLQVQPSKASIKGQAVDLHQLPELKELCLEVDASCRELHNECHELHESCQSHEHSDCTEDKVANAFGGVNDGLLCKVGVEI